MLKTFERGVLLGLGALLGAARIGSHLHLHLPGHQGLIRVAALMVAARVFRVPWAATIMASGAGVMASFSPAHGLDTTALLSFLLCALAIDFADRAAPHWQTNVVFLGVVGALANATKPLALWLIKAVTGFPFDSLDHGLAYPVATHLAFGLAGGITAWGVLLMLPRKR